MSLALLSSFNNLSFSRNNGLSTQQRRLFDVKFNKLYELDERRELSGEIGEGGVGSNRFQFEELH